MSWTPTFWIREDDFNAHKKDFEDVSDYQVRAWKFTVSGIPGIVFSAGETSQGHRDLHDVIEKIPHWILNGECGAGKCMFCHEWGDEVDLEFI